MPVEMVLCHECSKPGQWFEERIVNNCAIHNRLTCIHKFQMNGTLCKFITLDNDGNKKDIYLHGSCIKEASGKLTLIRR